MRQLNAILRKAFKKAFQRLITRSIDCIVLHGDYIENLEKIDYSCCSSLITEFFQELIEHTVYISLVRNIPEKQDRPRVPLLFVTEVNLNTIALIIQDDAALTIKQLAGIMNVSYSSIQTILKCENP